MTTKPMTADEALREVANTIAKVMIDVGYLESEAARAVELIIRNHPDEMRGSILADVIEPDGTRFCLFAAFGDPEAARLLRLARESGASVSTSCTLLDAVQSAWRRLWGSLGPMEPESGDVMH